MEVVHHQLLIGLALKLDERVGIVGPVVAASHDKDLVGAVLTDSCDHVEHASVGAITMNEDVGLVVVWLVVELVEDVVVSGECSRNTLPELNSATSAGSLFEGHILLLTVIIVPVKVEDYDTTHASDLIDDLADHFLVLLAELGVLAKVLFGGIGLNSEPVACSHWESEGWHDTIRHDLREVSFYSIHCLRIQGCDDVGVIVPVVRGPAIHANATEQVLCAGGAETVENGLSAIVEELVVTDCPGTSSCYGSCSCDEERFHNK